MSIPSWALAALGNLPGRTLLPHVRARRIEENGPNRRELSSYTVVVLATIVIMTAFVASLDYAFLKGVVKIFS